LIINLAIELIAFSASEKVWLLCSQGGRNEWGNRK